MQFIYISNPNLNSPRITKSDQRLWWPLAMHPLGSISASVLSHFGPFYKDWTDKGPKWMSRSVLRTEVDTAWLEKGLNWTYKTSDFRLVCDHFVAFYTSTILNLAIW